MIIISVTVIFDCLLDIRISQVQTINSYSVLLVLKVLINVNQEEKKYPSAAVCLNGINNWNKQLVGDKFTTMPHGQLFFFF